MIKLLQSDFDVFIFGNITVNANPCLQCTILALYSHYTSIYLHFTFLTDFGQPDNSWGNEHCVAMQEEYDFYWNDVPCGSSSYKSLCEIKHQ